MRTAFLLLALFFLTACGANADGPGKGDEASGGAAAEGGLTQSQLENGIGPVDNVSLAAVDDALPPGSYDEYYAFMSGGFSGNLTVHGLPSGRLLKTVAVFSQHPENGYGYIEETKAMLETSHGLVPWGGAYHPELSMTDGVPDGR